MKVLNEILLLEPGGEIRVGDGAPGVNFTGLRIYKTSSGYRFETYVDDELQVQLNEDGTLRRSDGGELSSDILDSDNVWSGLNAFRKMIILGDNASLQSANVVRGMLGSGTILKKNDKGKWELEVDSLRVRGSMAVMELLFSQVRATNGSLWVSSTGKVKAINVVSV